jgi:hypothetical protein
MASSMKLAYPLNDVLPNVEHTRDRLLAKVFEFRQTGLGKVIAKDEDYELLYAYGESPYHYAHILRPCTDVLHSFGDSTAGARPRNYRTGDRKVVWCLE